GGLALEQPGELNELAALFRAQCLEQFVPMFAGQAKKAKHVFSLLFEVWSRPEYALEWPQHVLTAEHPPLAGIEDERRAIARGVIGHHLPASHDRHRTPPRLRPFRDLSRLVRWNRAGPDLPAVDRSLVADVLAVDDGLPTGDWQIGEIALVAAVERF